MPGLVVVSYIGQAFCNSNAADLELQKDSGVSRRIYSSATTLLPGQDNSGPSAPTLGAFSFVVSRGVRLSEVGFSEFRKPQVSKIRNTNHESRISFCVLHVGW
jgi:hypothetical protein